MPSPSQNPTTLQDIADRLGLAKSTVSLGLRDKGTLSKDTRNRIKQTAKTMGYRPDPILAALANRRKNIPADLVPVAFLSDTDANLPRTYFQACSHHAAELGYRLEHRIAESDRNMTRQLRELWHRGTRGLILHGIPPGTWMQSGHLRDFAVVQCRLHRHPLPFTTVRADIVPKTHATIEHILSAGYRRIGNAVMLTSPDHSHPEDLERIGGVIGAQFRFASRAFFPKPLWIHLPHKSKSAWRTAARNWVTHHRLDALVCTTEGLSDLLFGGWPHQPHTACTLLRDSGPRTCPGMKDNTGLIGEKCLELIDQFIRARSFGIPAFPYDIIIPSTWKPL